MRCTAVDAQRASVSSACASAAAWARQLCLRWVVCTAACIMMVCCSSAHLHVFRAVIRPPAHLGTLRWYVVRTFRETHTKGLLRHVRIHSWGPMEPCMDGWMHTCRSSPLGMVFSVRPKQAGCRQLHQIWSQHLVSHEPRPLNTTAHHKQNESHTSTS